MQLRIRIENLTFKPNVPAGMNPYVLLGLVHRLKSTTEDYEPILISKLRKNLYRIEDGRHRFVASIIAGRSDILCELELNEEINKRLW